MKPGAHHDHCQHDHHGHSHHHHTIAKEQINKAFVISAVINLIFVIVEFFYGYISQSVSLTADATHNLSDVLTLMLAWIGHYLSYKLTKKEYAFGYKKISLLISLVNSIFVFVVMGYILIEAWNRYRNPVPVSGLVVSLIALIGIFVNFGTAMLFRKHQSDLNAKGAYLHLFIDALISLVVSVSGVIVYYTGYAVIDPVLAVIVVLIMIKSSWNLLKESFLLLIGHSPMNISVAEIENFLTEYKQIQNISEVKVWAVSSSENYLAVKIKLTDSNNIENTTSELEKKLKNKYHFEKIYIHVL